MCLILYMNTTNHTFDTNDYHKEILKNLQLKNASIFDSIIITWSSWMKKVVPRKDRINSIISKSIDATDLLMHDAFQSETGYSVRRKNCKFYLSGLTGLFWLHTKNI